MVAGFDGSGKRTLANSGQIPFSGGGACGDPGMLTTDGSKAYLADVGLLFDTDGSSMFSMTLPTWVPGATLLSARQYGGWMNGNGSRFSFVAQDANGRLQLTLLELDPANLRAAPGINQASVTPPRFLRGEGVSPAMVTARVTAPGTLHGVSTVFARDGMRDPNLGAPQALVDDGNMYGDAQAADGIFSSNRSAISTAAAPGACTLRIHAENTTDGRRHGTVLELTGLQVQ